MTRARDRDEDFRHFVEAHWLGLTRSAYLLLGDHGAAEDLVQQTLASVYPHWRRGVRDGAPVAYVRKAMVNRVISDARRRRVRETLLGRLSSDGAASEDLGAPLSVADPRDDYRVVEDRDLIVRALRRLPPQMRAVVVLRYLDDLTEAATADILGISVGSVKSQSSRGLDRLRAVVRAGQSEGTRS